MSRHLEKILAHAERELTSTGAQRPTDVLPVYRRFLKIEEHRLRLRQRAGDGGREVCARRVDLIDVLLRHVFAAANHVVNDRNGTLPIALVALGGYGRRELNPCSDVDVMFLHREQGRNVSKATSQIIEQVLYLLWDIGFKVGHSTRTIKEAIAAANADMVTKTAMLESRLVTGDRDLEQKFREQFRAKCVAGYEREYIEMRMRDQQARHAKFGNSVYLQEPNLKSGCGSLRDYQNLLWMTFFKEGSLTTTHLVGKDWLSEPDRRRIEAAYDFLLRVRTELHYLHHRATDVLHLNMQETMAQRLRYPQERGLLRSEALMKDVYAHSRNIFRVTERITAQFASGYSSAKTRSLFGFLPRAKPAAVRVNGFIIPDRQFDIERPDLFTKNPVEMMRAIEIAQERQLELSPELADTLSRKIGLITHPLRYAKEPREIFRRILSRKGEVGRALRLMHRLDFLGQYIPEFGQLTCLVQHEFFHRYTADEHTLVCIDKLDALARTENPKLIQDQKNLEALMLLTLADGQGTSDQNWSDWKETLVWQLYHATTQYLADRHSFYERAKTAREARESLVQARLGPDYADEIEAHFDFMPDHYFRAFKVADMVAHVELFRRFYDATCFGEPPLAPVFSWEPMPEQGHTVLTLCSWDRRQLLSKIAGSISLVPLNILSADIFTRGDNVALDVFRVSDLRGRAVTNEREMALVESTLRRTLESEA